MGLAAIYARVSSTRQKEEQTIASQTQALREYAAASGLEVPADWTFEDAGYSGASLIRPALERLRDLAAQVDVPVVLCYAPDRLARRYAYQALLVDEFARVGTDVRFLKGPKASTPEDELLLQFQGVIAEYERAQIAERTRRGKLHRARAGALSVLSAAPYGYRYIAKREAGEARYEIVEPEATVVRELFARYVTDHVAIGELARELMARSIRSPRGQAHWNRSTIGRLLNNPAYCGRAAFGKRRCTDERARLTRSARLPGRRCGRATRCRPRTEWLEIRVPAIVSEECFAQAQRQLEDNRRFAARRTKMPSLLQGLAICDQCGYSFARASAKTTRGMLYYYRCLGSDADRFVHGRVCQNRPVRQDYLDELVWQHVVTLVADPTLIQAELARRLDAANASDPATAQRARVEWELQRTMAARTRLLAAYQDALLSLEELRERMPSLREKEGVLRAQLDALNAQTQDRQRYLTLAETIESFLARLREAAGTASVIERQRVLRLLIKDVLVGVDRVIIRHCLGIPRPEGTPDYRLRPRRLVVEPDEAEALVRAPPEERPGEAAEDAAAERLLTREAAKERVEQFGAKGAIEVAAFLWRRRDEEFGRDGVHGGED